MSRSALALLLILGSATVAQAREIPPSSIGISGMAMEAIDTSAANTTDVLTGPSLDLLIPAGDNIAFQFRYYMLKGSGGSKASPLGATGVTNTGGGMAMLLGTNWRQGWNGYIGLGGFSERISGVSTVVNYTGGGAEGILGFGYQGATFTAHLALAGRSGQNYENAYFTTSGGKVRIVTATFDLGMRF